VFNQFKEKTSFRPHFAVEGLHGGTLMGLRSTDFICFYDWAESRVIRRIDVAVKDVWWSEATDLVAIASEASFFILRYNAQATVAAFENGNVDESEGVENAFELLAEVGETVRTAVWVGECFIYNNTDWRLNYCVGGEVTTIFHLDRPMYLLGYLAAQNRVYLIDKDFSVVSYTLLLSLIEYKTLVLRGEFEAAEELLPTIPKERHNNMARFLESRGLVSDALRLATDPDYKFELAMQLGELLVARSIIDDNSVSAVESKWKQLGESAMSAGNIQLASACLSKAGDLSGQLLLYSATASTVKLQELANLARHTGKNNVAFVCLFLLNKIDDCIELLCNTGRIPEAAFMSRAFAPSKISRIVDLWRSDLSKTNKKAANALADPAEYKNLFPNFDSSLQVEEHFRSNTLIIPALSFGDRESNALSGIADNMSAVKLSDDKQNVDANMMHDAEVVCEDLTQLHEAGNLTESNQKQANEMDTNHLETAATVIDPDNPDDDWVLKDTGNLGAHC
jgi:coatomer subunit beta'